LIIILSASIIIFHSYAELLGISSCCNLHVIYTTT